IVKFKPDMVIVDISLPGRDGIELTKDLKVQRPDLPVLVLSMHDESLYADRALRAGARGYIMKQESPENLIRAIRRVLAGEIAVSQNTVGRILARMDGTHSKVGASPLELLSDRELEVFRLIGSGHSRSQIAAELHLSVKTVEAHRAKIREKLGLQNATQLLQHALQFSWDQGSGARNKPRRS
ncbi:MAG: response regulator transcription factor, partial [Verrucomicrobiia bacterium]